jgi:UDP-2-acetamido-3-amino-2,3-dideoxy-glucuronate N-acetyltransferase
MQKNAFIGARCKISSHTFICEGVTIEDEVFIGHGVMFTNDLRPRAANPDGSPQSEADWAVVPTLVKRTASIGSNATIIAGVTIGLGALVGAGAVVTKTCLTMQSWPGFLRASSAIRGNRNGQGAGTRRSS